MESNDHAACRFEHPLPVPSNWITHQTLQNSPSLRQVLAIGVRCDQNPLLLYDQAVICLETVTRKVHVFAYEGPTLQLTNAAAEELGSLADAMYEHGLHECGNWSIDYIQGVGCRIQEGLIKIRQTGYARSLRRVSSTPPSKEGRFHAWLEVPLLSTTLEQCREMIGTSLRNIFSREDALLDLQDSISLPNIGIIVRDQIEAFVSLLQPSALKACRSTERYSVLAFNAYANPDESIAKLRLRAAEAFPIVGVLCAERWEPDMLGIRLAIDRKLSLVEIAARSFDVCKDQIRFLSRKSLAQLALYDLEQGSTDARERIRLWIDSPGLVLKALDAIEPDHRPSRRDEWLAFYELVKQFDSWYTIPRELFAPFFKDAGRRGLQATQERIAERYGRASPIADCREFLDEVAELFAYDAHTIDGAEAIARFSATRGMWKLLEHSQRWQRALAREIELRLDTLEFLQAPPISLPFEIPNEIDGLQIVFIDRYCALVEEGLRMSHCVANLYPAMLTADQLVFSLRTSEDRTLATFDISLTSEVSGIRVSLNQLRGYMNAPVPDFYQEVVSRFLSSVQIEMSQRREIVEEWLKRRSLDENNWIEKDLPDTLSQAKRAAVIGVLGEF